ncbi:hypothetical protein [Frigidibacter sp. MR17.24]|uniref:hypothetical protein n=1 Tax=Frigidibacter sp. MR17.24 TaxID=3127345 RepID=UPI003012C715
MYDAPPVSAAIALPVTLRLRLPAQQERALRRWLQVYKRPGGFALERDPEGGRQCHRLSLRTPQEAVDVVEVWQLQLWA